MTIGRGSPEAVLHEVVGFSGEAKYLFPGISGGEFLHFFHWLAAVITWVLATGIPEALCRRINVGYMAPHRIHLTDYMNRAEQGILCVEPTGEILHRLEPPRAEA